MKSAFVKIFKWSVVTVVACVVTLMGVRIYDSQSGPQLELWHTFIPHELTAKQIDNSDWAQYLAAEDRVFAEVRDGVTNHLDQESRSAGNRYFIDSPIYPGKFAHDWNRSYTMDPEGKPIGAVVLLHGLTDSPYSLRHIARRYRERGFTVVAIRMPGHGTVPAGLTNIEWEQWTAATRLAVREAQRRAGPGTPLHLVGFSNGGALAMKYSLEALTDNTLARPDRIVLISPMIGITSMARFAGMFGWPAIIPAFAKAAWLSVVPEFNPFKYNSFPVNGARQTSLISRALQERISLYANEGRLGELAPIITFHSVADFTVSTRAIVNALYANLPANGSELVLFDLNRNARMGLLLRTSTDTMMARLLPDAPRSFKTTIITNASPSRAEVIEQVTPAGSTTEQTRALGLSYPRDVFSLSHLALPFPMSDSLYGLEPDTIDEYGANLGAMAVRGERGTLIVSLDSLTRMSSNPFFPYMQARIEEGIPSADQSTGAATGTASGTK